MTPPSWSGTGSAPSPPIPDALPFARRDARKNDFFPDPADPSRYYGVRALLHKQCGGELRYDQFANGGGAHKCGTCWATNRGGGFWRMTTIQKFSDQDVGLRFWAIDK